MSRGLCNRLKDAGIVLYCGGGYRSALAAANLQDMGYTRVLSMDGGIKAWCQAGFPIEQGPGPAVIEEKPSTRVFDKGTGGPI